MGTHRFSNRLVARWVEAFNVRDLPGMLSYTAPSIVFKPLRLHGVERTYIGHDGIARWLERLLRLGLDYQVQLDHLSTPAIGTVLATGRLNLEGLTSAAPAWGVYSIENELIVLARHYLGDEERPRGSPSDDRSAVRSVPHQPRARQGDRILTAPERALAGS